MSWPNKPSDLTDHEWDLIKPIILKQYDPHTRIEMKTDFSISSEKPKSEEIYIGVFVSENPPDLYKPKAIKIEVSEKLSLYLSGDSSLISEIKSILNDDDEYSYSNFESIKSSIINVFDNGSALTNDLIKAISEVFAKDSIVTENLYSPIDLKRMKGDPSIIDGIKNIDQNIKLFIKNNKIYAGLSYLKDIVFGLKYGFGVYYEQPEYNKYNKNTKKFNKIVVYPEYIIWGFRYRGRYRMEDIEGFDRNGDLISKIIEHVFALFSKTNHSDPVAKLYKKLREKQIVNFKAEALVCIIEALVKNNEKNLIEDAVSQLKKNRTDSSNY